MTADATHPERIGRFALLRPLGEGGMARVFIAQKDGASEVCVLKQLHLQLEGMEEAMRRFQREAHIASYLQHPGIAQVTDAGVEDDRFCIAMELIAGQTVEAMIKEARRRGGVMPAQISLAILLQALDALHYAHELTDSEGRPLGLVHRDLSPRNIMVDYSGQVKLIDFGIAKGNVDEHKTQAGALMGTPYYMSPEQAKAVSVDRRSDLYTLSAVFFEMLAGRRLVQAQGRAKILISVVRDLAPAVTTLHPHVPATMDPVVARALTKAPEARWPTADAYRQALLQSLGTLEPTGPEILGQYLSSLFPDGPQQSQALFDLARPMQDAPPVEATRVASDAHPDWAMPAVPSAMVASDASVRTRTAYVPEAHLSEPELVARPPTYTDVVMPSAVDSGSDHFAVTHPEPARSSQHTSAAGLRPATKPGWLSLGALATMLLLLGVVAFIAYDALGPASAPLVVTNPAAPAPASPAISASAAPSVAPAAPTQVTAAVSPRRSPSAPPKAARRSPPRKKRSAAAPRPPPALPPPAPPPPAVQAPYRYLRVKLRMVKEERSRESALALQRQIKKAARRLPPGDRRTQVEYDADRVTRMGDINAMIPALEAALNTLSKP